MMHKTAENSSAFILRARINIVEWWSLYDYAVWRSEILVDVKMCSWKMGEEKSGASRPAGKFKNGQPKF
jgi:hypothetical protein